MFAQVQQIFLEKNFAKSMLISTLDHRNPTSRSRIVVFSEEKSAKSFHLLLYPKTGFNSCNGHVKGDQISL
jgi:hypothetical protein